MAQLGPLGGGELYRTLLIYLDGGGIATSRVDTVDLDEKGPFDPQQRQEQCLESAIARGNNAATLSVTDARKAASNSICSAGPSFNRTFLAGSSIV